MRRNVSNFHLLHLCFRIIAEDKITLEGAAVVVVDDRTNLRSENSLPPPHQYPAQYSLNCAVLSHQLSLLRLYIGYYGDVFGILTRVEAGTLYCTFHNFNI